MKKLTICLLLFLGFTITSSAQTEQGTIAIGADFPRFFTGLSRSGMKLNVGVFMADDFLFGVNSGIRYRTLRNLSGRDLDGTALDFGLFARYYLPDQNNDFRIFIHGEGGLDRTWAGDLRERYEFMGLGGGLAFFFSDDLALEAHTTLRFNNKGGDLHFDTPGWGLGIKYLIGNSAE